MSLPNNYLSMLILYNLQISKIKLINKYLFTKILSIRNLNSILKFIIKLKIYTSNTDIFIKI